MKSKTKMKSTGQKKRGTKKEKKNSAQFVSPKNTNHWSVTVFISDIHSCLYMSAGMFDCVGTDYGQLAIFDHSFLGMFIVSGFVAVCVVVVCLVGDREDEEDERKTKKKLVTSALVKHILTFSMVFWCIFWLAFGSTP